MGTTAVNYEGAYNFKTSLDVYEHNFDLKNARLVQLKDFLLRETSIVGAIYFNVDLTNGLKNRTIGELDRSVIDFQSNKFYEKILDVYQAGKPNDVSAIYHIFNLRRLTLNKKTFLLKSDYSKPVQDLYSFTTTYLTGLKSQLNFLDQTKANGTLRNKYKRFNQTDLDAIVDTTKKFFQ